MSKMNLPSGSKLPARCRSRGPRSAEGKAIASRNALTHGLNSQLTVIEGENAGEFEGLAQGLVEDFRPQGTTEMLIVHQVANLVWKQRLLDRFEHDKVTQAALAPVGISEIFKKLDRYMMVGACGQYFEFLDEYDDADFERAESLGFECDEFHRMPHRFQDSTRCQIDFPLLSDNFTKIAIARNGNAEIVFGLGDPAAEIKRLNDWASAIVFLVEHRAEIYRARAEIRAEKIAQAWNLERSHRFTHYWKANSIRL